MDALNLTQPELYLNRYTSLAKFNARVLAYARDTRIPLLERTRYLCISSSNLDEFFEVRVALLKQRAESGLMQPGPDSQAPSIVLDNLAREIRELVSEQYRTLNDELIPALAKEDIRFLRRSHWSEEQREWLKRYFESDLAPVLSPLGLDPSHPFPMILNKSLNFIVALEGKDAFGRDSGRAIVQAPRALPRIVRFPDDISGGGDVFVFLSSIIHAHVDDLFPGMKSTGCYQFRVTRNSDLDVDEDEIVDLASALAGELSSRRYAAAVRLEVADNCPSELSDYLLGQFELSESDLYRVNGPVNLNRLLEVCNCVIRPDLNFTCFTQGLPERLKHGKNLFQVISEGDVLLHHPYQSFTPVIELVQQASCDVAVLAIKQTLYRTGPQSPIVDALVDAAKAGKEVTVVIELRARFDEADNIELASRLQQVGAHVVYGVVGYKTHAKMLLIVRREGHKLKRYVHLGTGNYHPQTARLYTDYGLMTCDKGIGQDLHRLFGQLTSLGKVTKLNKLVQSPFKLHDTLLVWIQNETEHAQAGKMARITLKVNSLTEPELIQALYRASQAGVKVELIVRGMCCLRPGVKGVSENIRVRSVVGRFLEHTRIYYFYGDGAEELFCASADLMERNLFRRVEIAFPILDTVNRKQILSDIQCYLKDNIDAWFLDSDGEYTRCVPGKKKPVQAQSVLLEALKESLT